MPLQAKANGLQLSEIPPELSDLNALEPRLICPRLSLELSGILRLIVYSRPCEKCACTNSSHKLTSTGPACSVYVEGTRSHNVYRLPHAIYYCSLPVSDSPRATAGDHAPRNSPAHQLAAPRMRSSPRICTLVLFIGSVCLSVCLSVTLHLTSRVLVRLTKDTTYLTGNEGQKFRTVFSENAPLQS